MSGYKYSDDELRERIRKKLANCKDDPFYIPSFCTVEVNELTEPELMLELSLCDISVDTPNNNDETVELYLDDAANDKLREIDMNDPWKKNPQDTKGWKKT